MVSLQPSPRDRPAVTSAWRSAAAQASAAASSSASAPKAKAPRQTPAAAGRRAPRQVPLSPASTFATTGVGNPGANSAVGPGAPKSDATASFAFWAERDDRETTPTVAEMMMTADFAAPAAMRRSGANSSQSQSQSSNYATAAYSRRRSTRGGGGGGGGGSAGGKRGEEALSGPADTGWTMMMFDDEPRHSNNSNAAANQQKKSTNDATNNAVRNDKANSAVASTKSNRNAVSANPTTPNSAATEQSSTTTTSRSEFESYMENLRSQLAAAQSAASAVSPTERSLHARADAVLDQMGRLDRQAATTMERLASPRSARSEAVASPPRTPRTPRTPRAELASPTSIRSSKSETLRGPSGWTMVLDNEEQQPDDEERDELLERSSSSGSSILEELQNDETVLRKQQQQEEEARQQEQTVMIQQQHQTAALRAQAQAKASLARAQAQQAVMLQRQQQRRQQQEEEQREQERQRQRREERSRRGREEERRRREAAAARSPQARMQRQQERQRQLREERRKQRLLQEQDERDDAAARTPTGATATTTTPSSTAARRRQWTAVVDEEEGRDDAANNDPPGVMESPRPPLHIETSDMQDVEDISFSSPFAASSSFRKGKVHLNLQLSPVSAGTASSFDDDSSSSSDNAKEEKYLREVSEITDDDDDVLSGSWSEKIEDEKTLDEILDEKKDNDDEDDEDGSLKISTFTALATNLTDLDSPRNIYTLEEEDEEEIDRPGPNSSANVSTVGSSTTDPVNNLTENLSNGTDLDISEYYAQSAQSALGMVLSATGVLSNKSDVASPLSQTDMSSGGVSSTLSQGDMLRSAKSAMEVIERALTQAESMVGGSPRQREDRALKTAATWAAPAKVFTFSGIDEEDTNAGTNTEQERGYDEDDNTRMSQDYEDEDDTFYSDMDSVTESDETLSLTDEYGYKYYDDYDGSYEEDVSYQSSDGSNENEDNKEGEPVSSKPILSPSLNYDHKFGILKDDREETPITDNTRSMIPSSKDNVPNMPFPIDLERAAKKDEEALGNREAQSSGNKKQKDIGSSFTDLSFDETSAIGMDNDAAMSRYLHRMNLFDTAQRMGDGSELPVSPHSDTMSSPDTKTLETDEFSMGKVGTLLLEPKKDLKDLINVIAGRDAPLCDSGDCRNGRELELIFTERMLAIEIETEVVGNMDRSTVRRENACGLLCMMVQSPSEKATIGHTRGVIPALSAALVDKNASMEQKHRCLYTLILLSQDSKVCSIMLRFYELVDALKAATIDENPHVRQVVCALLINLNKDKSNRIIVGQFFLERGTHIMELASTFDKVLPRRGNRSNAAGLSTVPSDMTMDRSLEEVDDIRSNDTTHVAGNHRRNDSVLNAHDVYFKARSAALRVLLDLSTVSNLAVDIARHESLFSTLLRQAGSLERDDNMIITGILANLTRHPANTVRFVGDGSYLLAVTNGFGNTIGDDNIRKFALYALRNLTVQRKAQEVMIANERMLSTLSSQYSTSTAAIIRIGVLHVLQNLSNCPSFFLKLFELNIMASLVSSIRDPAAPAEEKFLAGDILAASSKWAWSCAHTAKQAKAIYLGEDIGNSFGYRKPPTLQLDVKRVDQWV